MQLIGIQKQRPSGIMNPTSPGSASPTRPDDLAAVVRDAVLGYGEGGMNEEALLAAIRGFLAGMEREGIPHVLVGGLAVLQHVASRNTHGIDLIIAVEDMDRLPDFVLRERNDWSATGDCGPLRVDLLFTANPLFARIAREHAEERDFVGARLRCAMPEGIILLKLFTLPSLYRQGQSDRAALYETDILLLLRHHPLEDPVLLAQLEPHLIPSDIRALQQVLTEIRAGIANARLF